MCGDSPETCRLPGRPCRERPAISAFEGAATTPNPTDRRTGRPTPCAGPRLRVPRRRPAVTRCAPSSHREAKPWTSDQGGQLDGAPVRLGARRDQVGHRPRARRDVRRHRDRALVQPRRDALIAMVPPRLPNAALPMTVTGVLELAGAGRASRPDDGTRGGRMYCGADDRHVPGECPAGAVAGWNQDHATAVADGRAGRLRGGVSGGRVRLNGRRLSTGGAAGRGGWLMGIGRCGRYHFGGFGMARSTVSCGISVGWTTGFHGGWATRSSVPRAIVMECSHSVPNVA